MSARTRCSVVALAAAVLAVGVSCNYSGTVSSQETVLTVAEATIAARQTEVASPTPAWRPSRTPELPTATITVTPSPQPTETISCKEASQFLGDVTIPDNSSLKPGAAFTKTWRLRNSGSCPWTTNFEVVLVGGSGMGGPIKVPLSQGVMPGGTIDISLDMKAPTTNGIHRASYQLRDPAGALFGSVFYVQIVVGPTPTQAGAGQRVGQVTIDNDGSLDLDTGLSASDPLRDVWVHYVSEAERYLEPVNGARLAAMQGTPDRDACVNASLRSDAVSFADFASGSFFCYQTSEGRYGRFEVGRIEADSIAFDFRTWD